MQTYGGPFQHFDGTPPPTASDHPIEPEFGIPGTVARDPSTFVSHGIGGDTLGSYPGGGRSTLIPSMLAGPQIVSPARTSDGQGLQGPGTPEPALNGPQRGAAIEYGRIDLGWGPLIPLALVVVLGGYYLLTHK